MDIFGYNPIVSPIYVEPAFDRSNVVTTSQRQPRTVTGLIDSGAGFSIVQYSDGTTERREDARGIRNNNPGNLTGTLQGALRQGAVAVDHGGNYVFPDVQTGQRAMANFVLQRNADRSIGDMLSTYAPAGAANDPNNTNRLYPSMVQGAGFNLGDRVGALPAAEQQRLLDTMMGIETGQPAPARQLATLHSPGRGVAKRAMTMLEQVGAPANPMFRQLGTPGDALQVDPNAAQAGTASQMGSQLGTPGDALQVNPPPANQMFRQLGTPGDALQVDPAVNKEAAASKARTLGLMGDMGAAETIAGTVGDAVQEASSRGGFAGAKPLPRKEREKWSPESLGLIAFGLSLLGGADMAQATQIGLQTYNTVDDRRSLAKQREAVDKFISEQPPEMQEVLRLVGHDNKAIADLTMQFKELQGEQAKAEAIQTQLTEADLSPQMQRRIASAEDPAAELVKVQEASKFAEAALDATQQRHDVVMQQIQVVRDMIQGGARLNEATGMIETEKGLQNDIGFDGLMSLTQFIPRTRARDYADNLETLQANVGFNELRRLKAMSPTGGALGQVTERELDRLEAVLGKLAVGTSYETLLRSLDNVEASFNAILEAAQKDYSTYYVQPRSGPVSSGGDAQSFDIDGTSYNVRQN